MRTFLGLILLVLLAPPMLAQEAYEVETRDNLVTSFEIALAVYEANPDLPYALETAYYAYQAQGYAQQALAGNDGAWNDAYLYGEFAAYYSGNLYKYNPTASTEIYYYALQGAYQAAYAYYSSYSYSYYYYSYYGY